MSNPRGSVAAASDVGMPDEVARRELPPLIAHIVFSFDYGGLENGVVNLINMLPHSDFRHVVIALTSAGEMTTRIVRSDVEVIALHKPPGLGLKILWRLFRLLRHLRPAIVHTRNLSTLECAAVAWVAGVPARIHGEHGWDVFDPEGTRLRYRLLRRSVGCLVHRFVAVSQELENWLVAVVGISAGKVKRICNGVDEAKFRPRMDTDPRTVPLVVEHAGHRKDSIVIGTVTRFAEIKDPLNLVRAFILADRRIGGGKLRLVMIGDGVLRAECQQALHSAGLADRVWLPGSMDTTAELLRDLDIFVLASRREGISNTVLEAMATGLPVVATAVGGNLELIEHDATGTLVPPQDSEALANALCRYANEADVRRDHGFRARHRVLRNYALSTMRDRYHDLYRGQLELAWQ